MRLLLLILLVFFSNSLAFTQTRADLLQLRQTIGFAQTDDSIIRHAFVENGKKVFLLGQRNIQLWDVETGKLLNSVPHNISQLKPESFFSKYVLLGLPEKLKWAPFYFALNGKWLITLEKEANKKFRSAVVRDALTSKIITTLDLPNSISTEAITFDQNKNAIITTGQSGSDFAFAVWDQDTFQPQQIITIKDFRWWQPLADRSKMIVGTGGFQLFNFFGQNQGVTLTLRDVKTGTIEKEFTAPNLNAKSSFENTFVSQDEKFLVSTREKRIFVWELAGNGTPKFEVSPTAGQESMGLSESFGGHYMAVSVNKNLRIYDLANDAKPKFEFSSINPKETVYFYGANKAGKYFAAGNDERISVYDMSGSGQPLYEFAPADAKEKFYGADFDESGNYLLLERFNRKKEPAQKTEIYNLETGKFLFQAPFSKNYKFLITPQKKFIYTENLGSTVVWNFTEAKDFYIGLYTETPSETDSAGNTIYGTEQNVEFTSLSPDGKFVLKYGKYLTTIYDISTGKEIQTIFDSARVKYDKQNKIKDSGLNEAGWTENGRYVFAYSDSGKTMSFWEVSE